MTPVTSEGALFRGVVSIVPTKRRRFFWAAWWNAPPEERPFRAPDAASGGARTREEAFAQAVARAGRPLVATAPRWASAWSRVLRGEPPWPSTRPRSGEASRPAEAIADVARAGTKAWARALLGVRADATALELRAAFRALALATHPDRGGDAAAFIAAKRAYDVARALPRRRAIKR